MEYSDCDTKIRFFTSNGYLDEIVVNQFIIKLGKTSHIFPHGGLINIFKSYIGTTLMDEIEQKIYDGDVTIISTINKFVKFIESCIGELNVYRITYVDKKYKLIIYD